MLSIFARFDRQDWLARWGMRPVERLPSTPEQAAALENSRGSPSAQQSLRVECRSVGAKLTESLGGGWIVNMAGN